MTLTVWNEFPFRVEFSFLVVHILCNHWYVRGIVIWSILAVIPGEEKKWFTVYVINPKPQTCWSAVTCQVANWNLDRMLQAHLMMAE